MPLTTTWLQLVIPDGGDKSWHTPLRSAFQRLDRAFPHGTGSPVGVVSPVAPGILYYDTDAGEFWLAQTANDDQSWIQVTETLVVPLGDQSSSFKWRQGHFGVWNELAPSGSPSTITPDLSLGNFFWVSIASDLTVAAPTIPSFAANSEATTMTLVVKYTVDDLNVNFDSAYHWLGGTAPPNSKSAGDKDVFTFILDPDSEWLGNVDLGR